jgi:beta-lactamase regulating signal transducer with metallopeptidase domain
MNFHLSHTLTQSLGWTFLHSLWQGALVALLLAAILVPLQQKKAQLRYGASVAALLLVFVAALSTFYYYYTDKNGNREKMPLTITLSTDNQTTSDQTLQLNALDGDPASSVYIIEPTKSFSDYVKDYLPMIVRFWLLGTVLLLLRLLGGLSYIAYLRKTQISEIETNWQLRFQAILEQIGLKKAVRLVESGLVKTPIVIGYLKPMVLMPVGTINALAPQQVEAILAHELAHILRNDFIVNILQYIVEAIFYYHPAVWWISANIRTEREHCCDDAAVMVCGNSLTYAKALVALQEMTIHTPVFALSFAGGKNKYQLLNRVRRILNQPQNKSNLMEKFTATCLLIAGISILSLTNSSLDPVYAATNSIEAAYYPVIEEFSRFDTLPDNTIKTKKVMRIVERENNTEYDMLLEEGAIKQLKVNGKLIEANDYDKYKEKTDKFIAKLSDDMPMPMPSNMKPGDKVRMDRQKIVVDDNGDKFEVEMQNGEVKSLIINDKTIPASEYKKYQKKINKIKADLPAMPKMGDEGYQEMQPFLPEMPPVPPSPPSTPALPGYDVSTVRDANGNLTINISQEDGEPMHIQINRGMSININGISFKADDLEDLNLNFDNKTSLTCVSSKKGRQVKSIVQEAKSNQVCNTAPTTTHSQSSTFSFSYTSRNDDNDDKKDSDEMSNETDNNDEAEVSRIVANNRPQKQLLRSIQQELLNDNFISDQNDDFYIEIKEKCLKINNRCFANSSPEQQKYRKLYERISGKKLNKTTSWSYAREDGEDTEEEG